MRTLKCRNLVGVMPSSYMTRVLGTFFPYLLKTTLSFLLLYQPSAVLRTHCSLLLLFAGVSCSWEELCPNASFSLRTGSLSPPPAPPVLTPPPVKTSHPFLENSNACFPCLVWTSVQIGWCYWGQGPIHCCMSPVSGTVLGADFIIIQLKLNKRHWKWDLMIL